MSEFLKLSFWKPVSAAGRRKGKEKKGEEGSGERLGGEERDREDFKTKKQPGGKRKRRKEGKASIIYVKRWSERENRKSVSLSSFPFWQSFALSSSPSVSSLLFPLRQVREKKRRMGSLTRSAECISLFFRSPEERKKRIWRARDIRQKPRRKGGGEARACRPYLDVLFPRIPHDEIRRK